MTGSNGFVGGDLAALLARRGHSVVGLGRSPQPTGPVGAVGEYLCRDLGEPLDWDGTVDAVVHCAALAAPWAAPAAFQRANVDGTRHVVEWCRSHGRPHLVYISSTSVYYRDEDQIGLDEDSPIPEDREQINVYSRTKRIGERVAETYDGPLAILRPRAVFGPGDRVLFPRILRAARAGRLPLIRRPDGRPVMGDLLYVENLSHYIAAVVERGVAATLNLTNAEPVDLQAFLLGVLQRLGYPAPRRQVPLGLAMAMAGLSERVSAAFLNYREPPITRFGVSVFAWSKTFDVRRCLDLLGPPPVSLAEGVERLAAAWGKTS
ncbi:MAG: NAD(P)-dependent oxidoreductase [Acidobacteriota bacterium]